MGLSGSAQGRQVKQDELLFTWRVLLHSLINRPPLPDSLGLQDSKECPRVETLFELNSALSMPGLNLEVPNQVPIKAPPQHSRQHIVLAPIVTMIFTAKPAAYAIIPIRQPVGRATRADSATPIHPSLRLNAHLQTRSRLADGIPVKGTTRPIL